MGKQRLSVAMIGCGFMGRVHSNAFRQARCFFDLPYELKLTLFEFERTLYHCLPPRVLAFAVSLD
jgi:hypothetical protein